MSEHNHCIDICNRLLRGERSAVETYAQTVAKYPDEPIIVARLEAIRGKHARSVLALEENVRSMGGEPDVSSGPWGALAEVAQSTANILGIAAAIANLENGEKAGRGDYERALDDGEVMPACKELIRDRLLPPIAFHIAELETLARRAK